MTLDAHSVASFYEGPFGATVAGLIRDRLACLWPNGRGTRIVGLGYAAPYLGLWRDDALACADVLLAVPEPGWPSAGRCVAVGAHLPFDDLSVDRIVLVHGLEVADEVQRLLRECWRVLRDDGRLLVITPNRAGLWAHVEQTPFGQGQPYTQRQVSRLLQSSMFAVERQDTAVYMPPLDMRMVRRLATLCERVGRRLTPRLAGVLFAEAVKDVYAVVPAVSVRRRAALPVLKAVHARSLEYA